MGVWGVKGLVVRLVVALTVLVIAMQFLIALLTWEGTVQRRRRLTFTVEEGKDPAREVGVVEMGVVDVPGEQSSDTPSCSCGVEQVADRTSALLLGHPRRDRGFLTIGIPTVRREGGEYLFGTIDSLINCTTPEEKEETVLVIFLADFDPDIKKNATKELQLRYGNYLADGFMLVIEAPKTFYPSLENLKRTYNHPEKQVKWRSKQNYDYAFMFKYSSFLSTYYLQIEDDVQTTRNFLTAIKHYINDQTSPWVCLEFSTLGYIGKLYHSHDIEKLAKMLMLFYEEQPPDFLYLYFNVFLTQFQQRLRVPTLFQHMGYHSSLPDKVQPLKDNLFDNTVKQYHGDNPPATMYTNLETFAPFSPNLAYSLADGFFWAKESKKGDYLLLVFDRPEKLSSVIIDSGSEFHKDDRIQNATLEAAVTVVKKTPKEAECTNFVRLGTFVNGNIRVDKLPSLVPFDIFCFRVTLDQDHLNWLIFREIAVFR